MSSTTIPDRRNPDHNWTGDGSVASNADLADAVAHVKAWFTREIDDIKASAGPSVAALESKIATLEAKLNAALSTPAPVKSPSSPVDAGPSNPPAAVTSGSSVG